MDIISRGFSGRRAPENAKLPPGQYLTTDFPVLSAGPTPHVPLDRWEFTIDDGTDVLRRWDWKSFRDLRSEAFTVDLHCVTRWSKLGTSWEGVSLDTILMDVQTDASYALARSYGDYTTNVPLNDLRNKRAWIAFRYDGKDLAAEHGGPARLLVPHLYLWKSAKWVRGITLMPQDKRGSSVIRAASDVAYRNGRRSPRRNADGTDDHARSPGLARSHRGPARRCTGDGPGWILRCEIVLDRLLAEFPWAG